MLHVLVMSQFHLMSTVSISCVALISKVFTVQVQFIPVSDRVRLYQTSAAPAV